MLNIPNFQSKWITHVQTILQLTLVRYRTSNHYLPEETGRWNMTDISERKYLLCNKNDTGEELHYLLTCPFFNDSRLQNVPRFYHNNPNILKFKQRMNTKKHHCITFGIPMLLLLFSKKCIFHDFLLIYNIINYVKDGFQLKIKKYIFISTSQPHSTYESMPLWQIQTTELGPIS